MPQNRVSVSKTQFSVQKYIDIVTSAAALSSVLVFRDNKVSIASLSYKLIKRIEELSNRCNRTKKNCIDEGHRAARIIWVDLARQSSFSIGMTCGTGSKIALDWLYSLLLVAFLDSEWFVFTAEDY